MNQTQSLKSILQSGLLLSLVLLNFACKTGVNDKSINKKLMLGDASDSEELVRLIKKDYSTIGEYKLVETMKAGTSNDLNKDFFASEIKDLTVIASTDARYKYALGDINLSVYKFNVEAEAWKFFDYFDSTMVEAGEDVFKNMKEEAAKKGKEFKYIVEKTDDSVAILHKEKKIKLVVIKRRGTDESPFITHNGVGVNMTLRISGRFIFIATDNIFVSFRSNTRGGEVEDFYLQHDFLISELIKGL